jgi:preprotein translocase subunit YajC
LTSACRDYAVPDGTFAALHVSVRRLVHEEYIVTLRVFFIATAFVTGTVATPVLAQNATTASPATANVTAGATVLDTKGGTVGTIASVSSNVAVVDTGTVKAGIPTSAFAQGEKGLVIAMTKAELETAAQGSQAQTAAAITPGAVVADTSGGAVGKIDSVDGGFAVVATPNAKVRLPTAAFAKGPNGLVIGMTRPQLEAAAKGAAGGG